MNNEKPKLSPDETLKKTLWILLLVNTCLLLFFGIDKFQTSTTISLILNAVCIFGITTHAETEADRKEMTVSELISGVLLSCVPMVGAILLSSLIALIISGDIGILFS